MVYVTKFYPYLNTINEDFTNQNTRYHENIFINNDYIYRINVNNGECILDPIIIIYLMNSPFHSKELIFVFLQLFFFYILF